MSIHCRRPQCDHDVLDHDPELPHACYDPSTECACQSFVYADGLVVPSPAQASMQDLALEVAASHLAGMGRGQYHRVDIEAGPAHGRWVKLDGVELRGVQSLSVNASATGPTTITIAMIVSVGEDNPPP